ncbi:MAG: nucleoside 2-deoxyribosyltransferase [Cyanothece sp. SIO1E1]|nr:nucleoside 2-deoxyribosyltransferase [Cyanothece sp. SIO1E1]
MSNPPWIYLAGPLFTQAEVAFNATLTAGLNSAGYRIYLPQQECAGITDPEALFHRCIQGLEGASLVLVVLDGPDADSGSCFEVGYAYAKGLKIIGLRTDFRGSGEHMGINLMLTNSCSHLLLTTLKLPEELPSSVTYLEMEENVLPKLLSLLSDLSEAAQARA